MRFASAAEAAHALAVTPATIRFWCREGRMKSFKIGDFLHVNLWEFLKENNIDPKPIFDALDERKEKIPSARKRAYAKKARRAG